MKQYLVKKDVNKPNAENNWIVMNGYEFSCFLQTKEGERRKKNFATLDDGECHTGDIVVECDESEAKRIERERQCAYRRKKARYSIRILSLNHPSPLLGPSTFEEDVSGNLADVEQAALKISENNCFLMPSKHYRRYNRNCYGKCFFPQSRYL